MDDLNGIDILLTNHTRDIGRVVIGAETDNEVNARAAVHFRARINIAAAIGLLQHIIGGNVINIDELADIESA